MPESLEPGRLVISTAGRDKGKFYLVLEKALDSRVYVVDGEARKVLHPKLKNEKHLKACPEIAVEINEKIKAGLRVSDLDVRKAMREITAKLTQVTGCEEDG